MKLLDRFCLAVARRSLANGNLKALDAGAVWLGSAAGLLLLEGEGVDHHALSLGDVVEAEARGRF